MNVHKIQPGFTLLELVVVLSVIAILTATLIYGIPKWQEQSRLTVAIEMGRSIQQGTIAWCSQNTGLTPTLANTATGIPPFVQNGATTWNALTITGTTAVTPTFVTGQACGSNPDAVLSSVKWAGGCANAAQNIVYTVSTNSATCQ